MMNMSYEVFWEPWRFAENWNFENSATRVFFALTFHTRLPVPKKSQRGFFWDQNFTAESGALQIHGIKVAVISGNPHQLIESLIYEMLKIWSYTVSMNIVFVKKDIFYMIVDMIYVW